MPGMVGTGMLGQKGFSCCWIWEGPGCCMPALGGAAGASAESWKGSAILGPLPSMRAKLTWQPALNLRCLQDGCTGRCGQHDCKTCLELDCLCSSRCSSEVGLLTG